MILHVETSPPTTNNIEVENLPIITVAKNNKKLSDQVLTLPRKYWAINLRNDSILQHEDVCTGMDDMSVTTINAPLPKLLET